MVDGTLLAQAHPTYTVAHRDDNHQDTAPEYITIIGRISLINAYTAALIVARVAALPLTRMKS